MRQPAGRSLDILQKQPDEQDMRNDYFQRMSDQMAKEIEPLRLGRTTQQG